MKNRIKTIFFYLILFLSLLLIFSVVWVKNTFGLINLDSLLFHLTVPLKGTESSMVNSYLLDPLFKTIITIIVLFLISILFNYIRLEYRIIGSFKFFKRKRNNVDILHLLYKKRLLVSFIILLLSIYQTIISFEAWDYIKNLFIESNFIAENYVDTKKTNIKFKENRNLIHIYVESLENTFLSVDEGGALSTNLLPNLTDYAKKEVSFTNNFGGGFYNSRGTGWTVSGMIGQTAGIGFYLQINGNEFGSYTKFLPGVYTLGEILNERGYKQVLLIGSDGEFGGRNEYFTQHGNYIIKDYIYAKKNNMIPDDYYVWWGYEDSKLFEFAKEELKELSKESAPFNLTLLTTNTHHIGGYLEDDCKKKFEEQFMNVIYCSDKQIYDFIEWIKKQDFYNNTSIVITGDHLSMDPNFFEDYEDYERTNFNLFINAAKTPIKKNDRLFSTLDIFPTIIGSLGGNISGDRLGLGTDLFSNTKTLYEEYGKDYVESELEKNSQFYNNKIVYGIKTFKNDS